MRTGNQTDSWEFADLLKFVKKMTVLFYGIQPILAVMIDVFHAVYSSVGGAKGAEPGGWGSTGTKDGL